MKSARRHRGRHLAPRSRTAHIEDFVGGNVLAWLGGFAVLAGLAFLLTMAISRGWLGEGARTLLAGGLSLGLLGVGVWLREHRDRTEAAVVSAAVGIAGLFGTLVVAGPVYELIPRPVALFGAFATGAVAVTLAIRWRTQVYGWLGLLGALTAPVALGAIDAGGIVFLAIAFTATVAVLVWQRWSALAAAAVSVATLQWLWWVLVETSSAGAQVLTLVVFGVLTTALALGLEANRRGLHPVAIGPRARLFPHPFAIVLVINAAVLAVTGWELLDGSLWLAALAGAHIVVGIAAAHVRRISREVAVGLLAIGVVLADVAFASMASGLPLMLGWALSALPFAALLGARTGGSSRVFDRILGRPDSESAERVDRILALAGLLGQMVLAAGQTLVFARPEALAGPAATPEALIATAAFAVVAWASARLIRHPWRIGLDAVALAAVAHLTGLALEGAALTAMFAAEALALAELGRRRQDRYAAWAAVAFAGLGVAHALLTLAAPDALFSGLEAPLAAAAALGAAAIALVLVARAPLGIPDAARNLRAAAALVVLYLASVEVVTLGGAEDTGQTLLSVLWAVAAVGGADPRSARRRPAAAAFRAGADRRHRDQGVPLRPAALDSLYRVGSLIGFGILLLFGAFAYQRVRPQA